MSEKLIIFILLVVYLACPKHPDQIHLRWWNEIRLLLLVLWTIEYLGCTETSRVFFEDRITLILLDYFVQTRTDIIYLKHPSPLNFLNDMEYFHYIWFCMTKVWKHHVLWVGLCWIPSISSYFHQLKMWWVYQWILILRPPWPGVIPPVCGIFTGRCHNPGAETMGGSPSKGSKGNWITM